MHEFNNKRDNLNTQQDKTGENIIIQTKNVTFQISTYNEQITCNDKNIDLVIVADQLLTGYDSKYLNTLYVDRSLELQGLVQAYSRTNRLYGPEKEFGTIITYHWPAITEEAVNKAEDLCQNGLFTEADYELLNSIPKRAQQVISRNAKKFNDIASKTELSENESKQLDDILKHQKELITDIWNRIEVDKKAYFEREAKAKAEWKAQARAEEERLRAEYVDDLPSF